MVRITPMLEGPIPVLQVDGWLREDEAAELVRAVDDLDGSVVLDLAELRTADRPSIEILRGLRIRGYKVISLLNLFN